EVTTDTRLEITPDPGNGSVSASGINAGAVTGQGGLTTFEQFQADAAISFTFTDQAEVVFGYEVVDNRGSNANRNLLFDGNDLTFDGFETQIGVVPEPSSFAAIAAFLGLASGIHRRRK
ncbi:MAG: hypothetical protein ACQKBU_09120, partial [Verrucomicrobiales bacterium]